MDDFCLRSKTQIGREILLHPGPSTVEMPPSALDKLRTKFLFWCHSLSFVTKHHDTIGLFLVKYKLRLRILLHYIKLRVGQSVDRIPVEARFSAPVRSGPGAHLVSCTFSTGFLPEIKRTGCGVNHQRPGSAEVKERIKLYF